MSGREGSLFASLAQRVEGPGSQTQNLQVSGFGLSVWLAMLSVPWALAEECFLPGSGMIGEGGAGGTAVGALFPKCHSHDSDLGVLPLSLVFFSSTAFGPASVSLLYFPFLNLHKALRGLELPWGLLPLVRLVSGSWTADLGLSALEGPGKASGGLVGSRQANEPAPQGWPCTRHPAAGAGGGWRASVSDGAPGAGHRPSPPIHDRQALLYRQALLIAQPIPLASSPSQ